MSVIAIIGAGCGGLAAAHTLRDAGHTVVLYEQNREVGGRAFTSKQQGFIYDQGAQYIKRGNPESVALITERFATPDLIDISKPVWTFDGAGRIQEGDPVQNAEPRWTYRYGNVTLPQRMAEGLDIRCEAHIVRLQRSGTGWEIFDIAGHVSDRFDAVLIAIPAPLAIGLMQTSQLPSEIYKGIGAQLSKGRYNPLISIALGYQPRLQSRPYYALVNTDKAHAISWLAWEHEKAADRTPAGTGMLIAQMAPQYSQDHMQTRDDEIVRSVAAHIPALIGEDLPMPFFSDVQRWYYALPAEKIDAHALNTLTLPIGLAFCGDAFVGGRLHLALENGVTVAQQLIQ